MLVYELSGCGFESSCSHLNFRFRACFEPGVPWHSGSYRVGIHSEMRTWHNKNIQLIPLHLINSAFGISFKFHLNLDFNNSKILTFPSFYKQLFRNWSKYLLSFVNIPCSILSQPIWYNKNIKIGSKPIYVEEFVKQNFFFLYDFFNSGNEFKTWDKLGKKYSKKIKAQI